MAKNTGNDFRRGSVTGRNGEFMEVKQSPGPFKGVAKEPDGRDTENS